MPQFCLRGLAAALLLFAFMPVEASESFPDLKDDSVARIRRDLESLGREYLALPNLTRIKATTLKAKLSHLEMRCDRLGGEANPQLQPMLGLIQQFEDLVQDRYQQDAERERQRPKPYVFGSISGPGRRDGGLSDRGAQHLFKEVNQFVSHYRTLKHTEFTNNEVYLDNSRSYFRRTIEAAIDTALRRIENPARENTIFVGSGDGVVYDNYSPEENLQWAVNVTRIAEYFESKVGGSPVTWVQWRNKIQVLARKHKIVLK